MNKNNTMLPDHPVLDDLRWRHTTKKYDRARKVAADDLAVFYEALRLSASSINSQPWRFLVLESEHARERMHNTFVDRFLNNQPHVFDSSQFILFAYKIRYSREDYARVIDLHIEDGRIKPEDREAAFSSFVFAEMNTDASGSNACWTRAQMYLALGNALHTLARLRIDATPIEGIDAERVNREFAEELDGYRCDVALAIGYCHPEEDYNAKLPKSRKRLDEILFRL